ncbi:hypothetical protein QZH41_009472 [Actinostola sp. cb2023]|nr:hypothetical protein QZH41_009472 [Actinostola sp. cb2023]
MCFERDLRAELMDAKPKPILKSGAIPTVFSHRPVEKKRRISSEKRREVKDKQEFLQSIFEISEAACSMGQQDVAMEAMEAMETLPDFTNLACEPHTEPSNDDNDYVPTPSTMSRAWLHEQQTVWTDIGEREVWISGDGRCDSPGFSAKYGTYTMIDQETDKIVDFKLIQPQPGQAATVFTWEEKNKTESVVNALARLHITLDKSCFDPDDAIADFEGLVKSTKRNDHANAREYECVLDEITKNRDLFIALIGDPVKSEILKKANKALKGLGNLHQQANPPPTTGPIRHPSRAQSYRADVGAYPTVFFFATRLAT